jgi:hypothetical protein
MRCMNSVECDMPFVRSNISSTIVLVFFFLSSLMFAKSSTPIPGTGSPERASHLLLVYRTLVRDVT